MKVKVISVNKHNNEYNTQKDGLRSLEINKEYNLEVVGSSLNYFDRYELMYNNGRKVRDVMYPCGKSTGEDNNSYGIFVDVMNKRFVLFKDVKKE
ncbi:hypothetical protein DW711_10705 [Ruminococcus sp. AM27-16]|nr:hypothetical protein DW711_10705 [Ruminococcus sp. AM27-16]